MMKKTIKLIIDIIGILTTFFAGTALLLKSMPFPILSVFLIGISSILLIQTIDKHG